MYQNSANPLARASMTNDPIALRPATPEDASRVAGMLVELYDAELPGMLRGPHAARRALLVHTLQANSGAGLRGRRLIVDREDGIVGMVGLRVAGDPALDSAPPGTLRRGIELFGVIGTARMLGTLARTAFTRPPSLAAADVLVYGMFIEERHRRRGTGRSAILAAERVARERGCRAAHVQVLTSNHGARCFWKSAGYRVSRPAPARSILPTFPVETMSKVL